MKERFFASDHHLSQDAIIGFKDNESKLIRGAMFEDINDHDEYIISQHNKRVRPQDETFFCGDVLFKLNNIAMLERFNGRKILVKGNHDHFKLKRYAQYFADIISYKYFPIDRFVLSHIPVHPQTLSGRFKINVHGHTHQNNVKRKKWGLFEVEDPRYLNISMEQTNYAPVHIDEIRSFVDERIRLL